MPEINEAYLKQCIDNTKPEGFVKQLLHLAYCEDVPKLVAEIRRLKEAERNFRFVISECESDETYWWADRFDECFGEENDDD